MSDKKSFFDRYASPPQFTVIEGGKPEKKSYFAYGIAAPSNRAEAFLRLEFLDGEVQLMNKNHLVDVMCSSHQAITLGYGHCLIHLVGNRLEKVLDLIQDEGLRSLHCFNSNKHELPDEEAPVITEIIREMLTPASLSMAPSSKPSTNPAPWLKGDA